MERRSRSGERRPHQHDALPNAEGLAPLHPIAASFTSCDTDLPQIRFVMDADLPVMQGTRKIR